MFRGARLLRLARPSTLAAAASAAGLITAAGTSYSYIPSSADSAKPSLPDRAAWHKPNPSDKPLPTFTKAEVAKHNSLESGDKRVWVIFRGAVYDITEFIQNHPGGLDKILTAAGGSVEPFWALYRQHVQAGAAGAAPVPKDHVTEILAPLQIGWLDPAEAAAAAATRSDDDPYRHEPERHPALRLLSETPCSAETPAHLIGDAYLTPNALWYVRNHHPVPKLDADAFTLEVSGPGDATQTKTYSIKQLREMPSTTVTASMQCGGNRRGELNSVRKTSGNAWGIGAMSTAKFKGVRLRDVLLDAGVTAGPDVAHVQFEGVDGTKASVPVEKALSMAGDTLLAYEMNGEELPADHGYPLRVVVPGHVGVRNIKWVNRIVASSEEADGVWQRGMAYKSFGPDITSLDNIDIAKYAPIQEMPVQSAIFSPLPNAKCVDGAGSTIDVKGFAWSGGGRGIVRVDVSADNGKTWTTAQLGEGAEQPLHRAWAWTFWEAEVPVAEGFDGKSTTLVCKAIDAAHNSQPDSVAGVWNLRGLANNAWHRVPVRAAEED